MLRTFWSVKGGVGVSVTACAVALSLRDHGASVLLVDLAGDLPAALGAPEPTGPGLADWAAMEQPRAEALGRLVHPVGDGLSLLVSGSVGLGPQVDVEQLVAALVPLADEIVVDGGVRSVDPGRHRCCQALCAAGRSYLVTRSCYLALRRAAREDIHADGLVVQAEPGRALDGRDIEDVLGVPLVATLDVEPAVARAVDSGLLSRRAPRALLRAVAELG